jgi:hypothetical protein
MGHQKHRSVWHDRCHCYLQGKAVDLMNIEILFLASLFLIETTLLARVAVCERTRLATAADYGRRWPVLHK